LLREFKTRFAEYLERFSRMPPLYIRSFRCLSADSGFLRKFPGYVVCSFHSHSKDWSLVISVNDDNPTLTSRGL